MENLFSNKKNKHALQHLILLAIGVISIVTILYFSQNLKNTVLYPDTFTYVLQTKELAFFSEGIDLGAGSHPIDYYTNLKPLASVFTYLFYSSGISPILVNSSMLLISTELIYLAIQKKKLTFTDVLIPSVVFVLLLLNGNVVYWGNRYATEFISVLFLSALFFVTIRENKSFLYPVFILSALIRFELIFLFPIIATYLKLTPWSRAVPIILLIYAGIISLLLSDPNAFILTILLPYLVLEMVLNLKTIRILVNQLIQSILSRVWTLSIVSSILSLLLFIFRPTELPRILIGTFSADILMVGVFITIPLASWYGFTYSKHHREIKLMSVVGVLLIGIYMFKAWDAFRYWLYIIPIYAGLLSITLKALSERVQEFELVVVGLIVTALFQLAIASQFLPDASLQTNYWQNRFEYLSELEISDDYTIYSTTPVLTFEIGYRSASICELQPPLSEKSVIVVDDFSNNLCDNKEIQNIQSLIRSEKTVLTVRTEDYVEIERYSNDGQSSQFIIIAEQIYL